MSRQTSNGLHIQEHELVGVVAKFLAEQGYKVRAEVPNLGQSADLVATRGRWVTFVEVKVRDWRTAFAQCKAHKLVADYICIALGTKNISQAVVVAAAEAGIGLIHVEVDEGCSWVARPPLNGTVWRPQRQRFSRNLQAVEYVC